MSKQRTTWIVREGAVKGQGRYARRYVLGETDPWTEDRGLAMCFQRQYAQDYAASIGGRAVRIRIVSIGEQLRRAKERIEELEQAITTTDERAYQTGRAEERAAVVRWLPGAPPRSSWGYAKDIEEGVHVR